MSKRRRRFLRRLATPDVVSWPLLAASTGVLVADDVRQLLVRQLPAVDVPIALTNSITATLIGQAITFAVLLVARWTWLQTVWAQRHPMVTVWTFLLATAVAQVILALTWSRTSAVGLDRLIFQTATLLLVAAIDQAVSAHRREMSRLREARASRLIAVDQGRRALDYQTHEVVDEVDAVVAQALLALDEVGDELPEVLTGASEDVLRPLSHEIAVTQHPRVEIPLGGPRVPWRRVLAAVAARPLISPLAIAIVMTLLAARFTVTDGSGVQPQVEVDVGPASVGAAVEVSSLLGALARLSVVFGATYLSAWLVKRAAIPLMRSRGTAQRWAIVVLSVLPIALVAQLSVAFLFTSPRLEPLPALTLWSFTQFLLPIVAVALVMGIARTVSGAQLSLRSQVEQANEEFALEIAGINNELWAERQRLSRVVHGPVRAALIAGAIELRAARGCVDETQVREAIAASTRQRLVEARALLTGAPQVPDVAQALEDARRLWRGVSRIDSSITDAALVLLSQSPWGAEAAVAVCEEGVRNAVHHARATWITIDITSTEGLIDVRIMNDGEAPPSTSTPGLGSRLLNELTVNWSLARMDEVTVLRACIPVGKSSPTSRTAPGARPRRTH